MEPPASSSGTHTSTRLLDPEGQPQPREPGPKVLPDDDPPAKAFNRQRLLLGSYAVLFTRYCISTFLSSFFTPVATQAGISGTMNGLIFAAYPLGMALTSLVAPQLIQCIGTRAATVTGLLATSVFSVAMGFTPDLVGGDVGALQSLFLLCYFLNGMIGAVAETACIIMVSKLFADSLGVAMAGIGTVSGIGCMVGPVLGGVLYDAMPDSNGQPLPTWAFRLPFIVCSLMPLALLPPLPLYMPNDRIAASGEESAPLSSVFSLSVALGIVSIALSGTLVATLDPTLAYRLSQPPFALSATWLSFFFAFSSIVYTFTSIPIGWVVDRFPGNSRVFKSITALGFGFLALCFGVLAPLGPSAFGDSDTSMQDALNSVGAAAVALVLKGLGSAFSNVAIYPDLVVGLPADAPMLHATLSAVWNAAYAVGWAAGPALGGALYDAFRVNTLCMRLEKTSPPSSPPLDCLCDWVPQNGFDGFSSTVCFLSLAYGIVLAVAACANVRGRASQPLLSSVEPLSMPPAAPADAR